MILKGEKVILRYPKLSDAKWFFVNIKKPEIAQNLGPAPKKLKSVKDEIKWVKSQPAKRRKKETLNFAIVDKKTKKLIGSCGFNTINLDEKYVEAGWWTAKQYWGKGYALDAVKQLIKYGFNKMKLNRIEARMFVYNPRSHKFAKKLGFKDEGYMRKRHLFKGKFYDEYLVGLLRKEWKG